jgi:hypothetical protein
MLQYHLSLMTHISRGIAQLVEHWSPKPGVVGSSPATPAKIVKKIRHVSRIFSMINS